MRVLIDIPDQLYKDIKNGIWCGNNIISNAIEIGTPIPDNATNGNSVIKMFCKGIVRISPRKNVSVEFKKDWWNSLYQKGGKE